MKLKLKNTPEQVELIKKTGSRNMVEAAEAMEALASFVGPIIQKVLSQSGTASLIYKDMEYNEDDSPSYPLDLYYNENAGLVSVWAQNVAGGLPTNYMDQPVQELKLNTYRLDSSVAWLKKFARKARLDVVGGNLERMAQEVLVKQERNAWAVVLKALANGTTLNGRSAAFYSSTAETTNGLRHVIRAAGSTFTLADLNDLMVRIKRINVSFANGTPSDFQAKGLTDLFVSPEIKAQIRAFAFNPIFPTSGTGQSQLPPNAREEIYRNAGQESLFNVAITELIELGVGQKYNNLFSAFAGANSYSRLDGSTSAGTFAAATTQIIVGLDLSRDSFIRPVATGAESGGQFTVLPDNQYTDRSDKAGMYGFLEEGRICIDARAITGLIV